MHGWLVAAALASALRFALIAAFGAWVAVLVVAQCLHALSFAAQHSACIAVITRHFPGRLRGRGQALYTVLGYGASGVVGGVVGGAMSETPASPRCSGPRAPSRWPPPGAAGAPCAAKEPPADARPAPIALHPRRLLLAPADAQPVARGMAVAGDGPTLPAMQISTEPPAAAHKAKRRIWTGAVVAVVVAAGGHRVHQGRQPGRQSKERSRALGSSPPRSPVRSRRGCR